MLSRVLAIALNTYREAVRARLLLGVFAIAVATCGYSLIVASLSLHNELRVIANLGAASLSLYGVVVAIVLGSTSLHRELEYKTIFPILSRPIRRWEYLVGKYFGALLTVIVFIAVDSAAVLTILALEAGEKPWKVGGIGLSMLGLLALLLVWARHTRVFVAIPWALALAVAMWLVAAPALADRQLVAASAALAVCEVAIVASVATLFASFSSPFLTAAFTAMIFLIGRSADTLAHLPKRVFGHGIVLMGQMLARILPNLHTYVPPRSLLLGEVAGAAVWPYVGTAALHAIFYVTVLLVAGAFAFSRRDFGMSPGGLAALTAWIVISVVAIATAREIAVGREEVTQADAASARSDWPAAIAHARAAAEALVPASPWPGRGMLRLQAIGRDAEARRDEETALLAYGALRTAVLATHAAIGTSSSERWRMAAEEGLARVAASWSLPRGGGGGEGQSRIGMTAPPVSSQSMMDELRGAEPVSSSTLALLAAVSLMAIVALLRLAAATT